MDMHQTRIKDLQGQLTRNYN